MAEKIFHKASDLSRFLREAPAATQPASEIANVVEQSAGAIEERADRAEAQRAGWKDIGEVLIRAAFGFEMRGFGDTPPTELLEAIRGTAATPDEKQAGGPQQSAEAAARSVEALRDGLIGRAWHVGGHKGYGTCDYPLCAYRGKGVPLQTVDLVGPKPEERDQEQRRSTLKVCHHPQGNEPLECLQWAIYVKARAAAGRIEIK